MEEKPQVREVKRPEKRKLGGSSRGSSTYGDRSEREGWLVVWEEMVKGQSSGYRDRQRLGSSVPV